MQGVGWFLVVMGAIMVLGAVVRVGVEIAVALAARKRTEALQTAAAKMDTSALDALDPEKLAKLVEAIGKLPPYALTTLIGIVLIAAGERLVAGLQIFSWG